MGDGEQLDPELQVFEHVLANDEPSVAFQFGIEEQTDAIQEVSCN